MRGRPSNVAARGDWLVVRQFSVEKNWIARVTTSSPERVVCLVRTESAIWVFSVVVQPNEPAGFDARPVLAILTIVVKTFVCVWPIRALAVCKSAEYGHGNSPRRGAQKAPAGQRPFAGSPGGKGRDSPDPCKPHRAM